MIEARNITCQYGDNIVVGEVSLSISPGEVVGLVGPNGSGKTTVLRALYGRMPVSGGSVALDGQRIDRLPRRTIAKSIAVSLQEHDGSNELTVEQIVALGRTPHVGWRGALGRSDYQAISQAMEVCGVTDVANVPMPQLSGGQRQRAMLAQTMAQQAPYILLDEPTNHLDLRYQHEVLETVTGQSAGVGIVLHDLNLANTYCDRVVLMSAGRVVAAGKPADVLVPDLVEPVYGMAVHRVMGGASEHLVFERN